MPYETKHEDKILLERESYIYSICENKDKQNKLGTIAIDPEYINKNNYKVKKNTIYLYNNNNKEYYEIPGSIRGTDYVILTSSDAPRTAEHGGARRNKKHTRRHKKKRGKRSRKTRNNRRKH